MLIIPLKKKYCFKNKILLSRFVYPFCTLHIFNSNSIKHANTHRLDICECAGFTYFFMLGFTKHSGNQPEHPSNHQKHTFKFHAHQTNHCHSGYVTLHKHDATLTVYQLAITHLSFLHNEAKFALLKISPSCSVPSS